MFTDLTEQAPTSTPAFASPSVGAALPPTIIERREPRSDDVLIDIAFAGICHSDTHQTKDEWGDGIFPEFVTRGSPLLEPPLSRHYGRSVAS